MRGVLKGRQQVNLHQTAYSAIEGKVSNDLLNK